MNIAVHRAARELAARRVENIGDFDDKCGCAPAQRGIDRAALQERQCVVQPIAAARLALELQAGGVGLLE